jgi:kindlin 2
MSFYKNVFLLILNKKEIVGIASNRILRINPEGETLKSWRFNTMKSWNVNWDINQFEISFDDEELVFMCLNCDAKILHEFIGGYIYLSLRPKLDNNNLASNLNEEMFFKLTDKR